MPLAYVFPGVYDPVSFNKMAQIITAVGAAAYEGAIPLFVNKVRRHSSSYHELSAMISQSILTEVALG